MIYLPSKFSVPSERPLLVFNHNPKAGGGTINNLLNDAFDDCNIRLNEFRGFNQTMIQKSVEDNCYVLAGEWKHTSYPERKKAFIIGSVREPCSHYLSLWAFSSAGYGEMYKKKFKRKKEHLLGKDGPHYSSPSDIQTFRAWLEDEDIKGVISQRFEASYLFQEEDDKSSAKHLEVDCFVYVDDFQPSLLRCLKMYEEQGGTLQWNSTSLVTLVQTVKQQKNEKERRELRYVKKESIEGDPRLQHHAPCSTYFDETTSRQIENGPDSAIFNTFGYKCCEKRDSSVDLFQRKKPTTNVVPPTNSVMANTTVYPHVAPPTPAFQYSIVPIRGGDIVVVAFLFTVALLIMHARRLFYGSN